MDPVYLKRTYGRELVLHGGINAVLWDQPDEIAAEMERVVPVLKEGGGYIFSSDHSVPSSVGLEDFRRIVALARKLLADREWLRIGEEGLGLEQPEALLEEWAANYSFRKNPLLDGYSLQKPAGIEAGLAERCAAQGIRYALTGFSGAARMAPAVRYQRVFAFVEGDPQETARQLGLKEAASGANVSLLSPYDEGVFYGVREVEGIWVASPIQVYLDLIGFRGRGEEAARSVLEEVIKPQW
jgi:hypothetical protein